MNFEKVVEIQTKELNELKEKLKYMETAIRFFASVINCGEGWSDECERIFDKATK
jgi:hypothetical protein